MPRAKSKTPQSPLVLLPSLSPAGFTWEIRPLDVLNICSLFPLHCQGDHFGLVLLLLSRASAGFFLLESQSLALLTGLGVPRVRQAPSSGGLCGHCQPGWTPLTQPKRQTNQWPSRGGCKPGEHLEGSGASGQLVLEKLPPSKGKAGWELDEEGPVSKSKSLKEGPIPSPTLTTLGITLLGWRVEM